MINHTKVREALAQRQQAQECTHPTDQIIDLPTRSYCRKCGEDVLPLARCTAVKVQKVQGVDWGQGDVAVEFKIEIGEDGEPKMTNFKKAEPSKSIFPLFPSAEQG